MSSNGSRALSRRVKAVITSCIVGLALMLATGAQANPLNEDVAKVNDKFQTFASLMGRLDELSALSDDLPISDKALADVLQIAKLFDDDGTPDDAAYQSLKERLDAATDVDWDNLGAALDALDCTQATCGLAVNVSGPGSSDDGSDPVYVADSNPSADDAGIVDIAFELKVTGEDIQVPVLFANDLINLSGGANGTFPLDLELKTTVLHFQIDKAKLHNADLGVQSQAVALRLMPTDAAVPDAAKRVAPAFLFSASATDASIGEFHADLGFTDVSAVGTVSFNIDGRADLRDPDDSDGPDQPLMGDGFISADEWATTGFATLLDARLVDEAGPAVDATIRLSTGLVPDSLDGPDDGTTPDHDASIRFVEQNLTDNVGPEITMLPDASFGQVGNFRNMSPGEAVAALLRLVQFLDGLQATDTLDLDLPFIGGGAPNASDPASSPSGTFSDALRIGNELKSAITTGANQLMTADNPATPEVEESRPTFTNLQQMITKLNAALTALGMPHTISPTYVPAAGDVPARLDFNLELKKSHTAQIIPAFDNLDILSAIKVSSSPFTLNAAYDIKVPLGLSLKPQPREDNGPIGSCTDEIDNGGDTTTDAADPDCAAAQTIQQRVGLRVGTGAVNEVPEVNASVRLDSPDINATARIGILEAAVDGARLDVLGKVNGEGANASDTVATCSDGDDDDSDGKTDADDPDCNAGVVVDFKDTVDGFLTVEDLFNAMGAGTAPTGADMDAKATAAFVASIPVDASVGSTNLANGTIKASAAVTNADLLDPNGSGVAALVESVNVDASDLHTKEIFNFSPCSNSTDDDGDGKVNDGCEKEGAAPEPDTQCADNVDNDTDGVVNDGCAPSDDPETSSARLFTQIVEAIRGVSSVLESTGLIDGDQPIPLIDKSYNELLGYVDALDALTGGMAEGAESGLSLANDANPCEGSGDDDHDGYANDGCPTIGQNGEVDSVSTSGQQCAKGNTADDDGDGKVNDGCPPQQPTLNDIATQVGDLLDSIFDGLPGADPNTDHANVSLSYDEADNSIRFDLHAEPSLSRTVPLNLDLGGDAGSLVSLNSAGDLEAALTGVLDLDFGVEVDDFQPFLLDTSGLSVTASAQSHNLTLQAGIGPITVQVGDLVERAETACNDTDDNDGDGFVNDGCPAGDGTDDGEEAAGESGAQCANTTNDDDSDEDSLVNDGCPAKADPGKFDLSGAFNLAVADDAGDHKHYFNELSAATFQATLGGTNDADCVGVATQNIGANDPKHACAVLPLYFDSDGPNGPTPPAPLGDPLTRAHQLRAAIADLSSPTVDFSAFDWTQITSQITSQVIDMLLLNSGLQNLIDLLRSVLNQELFGFKLPFIGDQLSQAADIVDTLEQGLKKSLSDAMGGNSPQNPIGAATSARMVQEAIDGFRTQVGEALVGAGILLNSAGDGPGTADDFKIDLRCKRGADPLEPCDTGGEDDAFNLAAGPNGGSAANCDNNTDDDNDGKTNDGCPKEGSFNDPDCDNAADEPDEDTTTAGPQEDDTKVNDGCGDVLEHSAADVYDIRFRAKLGKIGINLFDESLDFDIGVPGLGLETQNARLNGDVLWKIDIGFGISKDPDLGFYLVTDPDTGDTVDPAEILLEGTVGVSGEGPDAASITANLGFLRVKAIDGDPAAACATTGPTGTEPCRPSNDALDPRSSLSLKFEVNVKDPDQSSPDGLLAFSEIGSASFADVLGFRVAAVADVNFHIETSIAGSVTLPRLFADLHLDWSFHIGMNEAGVPTGNESTDVGDLNPNGDISDLDITLDGITLDAGTFVTKFLKPILQDVQRFTKPFQPLIDKLQAPIPVLSDLAGSPVTLLDLAQQLAPDTFHPDLIVAVVKIVDFVNTFDVSGTGNMQIPLGTTFNLNGNDLQKGELAEGDARKAFNPADLDALDAGGSLLGEISGRTAPAGAPPERSVSTMSSVGVSFPFIEQPSKILGLLFKQDVDLIRFETQLGAGFSYSQKFGPIWQLPPVFLEIGGSLSANVKFGIGYDTQGLRELLFENASADALLHGLFLIDYPGNEAELRGDLFANAQVSVLIFSAGAGGSVYLTIGIDLNDPNNDGKLKYEEAADILRTTGSPLCLFVLNGQFGVRIFVFAEVDLFFWSQRWEKTLADIVLFEFKVECDPLPEPVLAHPDGSTLVLHLGIDEGLRDTPANSGRSIGHDVIDEKFVVSRAKLPNPALPNKPIVDGLAVEAFGVTQFFPGTFTKVLARDAGDGNDVITMADGIAGAETKCAEPAPATAAADDDGDGTVNDGCPKSGTTPEGSPSSQCAPGNLADEDGDGFVNDGCKTIGDPLPFNLEVELHGGSGNDQLTGGDRASAGNGAFDDKLYGDDGDDTINAREGRNLLVGGKGKDKLGAGRSPDTIWGDNEDNSGSLADDDTNADTIDGGAEADQLHGGPGPDNISGGLANKDPKTKAVTNDGGDTINGNAGADTIEAGDGNDTVNGHEGGDRIQGGNGEDTITGGDEPEEACNASTPVDDTLVGGPDADTITAGGGDDVVIGGSPIAGQPDAGDHKLDGGNGCDEVFGDNATPSSDPGAGPRALVLLDPTIGGGDKMAGGNGSDRLHGQTGDDAIRGDDFLSNNLSVPNDDTDDGNDELFGHDGSDILFGDGGADGVYGAAGADDVVGGLGADRVQGDGGEDIVIGDDGYVTRTAGTPSREDDAETLSSSGSASQDHKDTMFGGTERDRLYGELSDDTMRGDEANDDMYGNEGADIMNGNTGDDLMFGNDGADDMFGDAGQDRMIGGSGNATTDDLGRDEMYGRFGLDVMAGDNATITPEGVVTLLAETTANKGDGDLMYGEEHADRMFGGLGADTMYGNADDDYMEGNAGTDTMEGNVGDDDMIGGTTQSGPVALRDAEGEGGQLDDTDTMRGGTGHDVMLGDNGRITRTGNPSPILSGAEERDVELFDLDSTNADLSGLDVMNGNEESDELYGGGDVDAMHGDGGDDHLEGNGGADNVWGDADQDDLIGGTSAAAGNDAGGLHPDAGDNLFGDAGSTDANETAGQADVIAGDNAEIVRVVVGNTVATDNLDPTRPGYSGIVRRVITLYDLATVASPNPLAPGNQPTSGGETIHGEGGPDVVYGQGGTDTLHGQDKDDYLEGNAEADTIYGQAGQDDLIGGTGRRKSDDALSVEDGRLDGADFLYGGNGVVEASDEDTGSDADVPVDSDDFDVVMGDNATVLRDLQPEGGDHVWEVNSFNASIQRRVHLFDVAETDNVGPLTNGTSGSDTMKGEADADVMYGQGANDTVEGNGDDDYMEGNAGNDTLLGGVGSDDMLGGTGQINGEPLDVDTRLDEGETLMSGGQGYDTMAGDNAVIRRILDDQGRWVRNTYNLGVQHERIFLRDLDDTLSPALAGTNGGETLMTGDSEDDVIYGQGGADAVQGRDGHDYLEGNGDADAITGDAGEDDILGGTGRVNHDGPDGTDGRFDGGDTISGEAGTGDGSTDGSGGDVVLADNGVLERALGVGGVWRASDANGVTVRRYVVRDLDVVGALSAAGTSGGDTVYGNDNDDVLYGQGGIDAVHGGSGDDYIEGGAAGDTLLGGPNQDDIIGGTGRDFDVETWIETNPPQHGVDGRLDGNDTIHGGDAADFAVGDNGLIQRREKDNGTWRVFDQANDTTTMRVATRRDVAGAAGTFGADVMNGDEGDDVLYGQDGSDTMHGDAANAVFRAQDNDDLYGELGKDFMFGDEGEDAMIGDRGNIVNTRLKDDSRKIFYDTQGPAFFKYTGLVAGQLDRRVSLLVDGDDAPGDPSMGLTVGEGDELRGGPGHDSMHGAFGDDLMNGDSGGDWLFGADGADVMWGGKGADNSSIDPADHISAADGLIALVPENTRGKNDRFVDYLFGGHGGLQPNEVDAADKLDFRPRSPGAGFPGDPAEWFRMTSTDDADTANNQHHHGIDWIYGGWDRDVLEGNVGKNGPDFGDRLIDWKGAYNMYTRCNASYGDDGDIYQITPQLMELLQAMAYGSGAGQSMEEVKTRGTSSFRELGLVYPNDSGNHGKAFPTTPGHFEKIDCSP